MSICEKTVVSDSKLNFSICISQYYAIFVQIVSCIGVVDLKWL